MPGKANESGLYLACAGEPVLCVHDHGDAPYNVLSSFGSIWKLGIGLWLVWFHGDPPTLDLCLLRHSYCVLSGC